MSESTNPTQAQTLPLRSATAISQAIALYLLTESSLPPKSWPATNPLVFLPLVAVFIFIPTLFQLGLGQIRMRPLGLWAAAATLLAAAFGYFHAARDLAPFDQIRVDFWFVLSLFFFIAQALVIDSVTSNSITPPYPLHFDTAWKQAIRAVLTAIFVGVFWLVLELGAGLFLLVDVHFFERFIDHLWFVYPATTLAIAVAIHLTDVQPSLISGARSLALTLFSWLLPLLAVILLAFISSLPFLSIKPLWNTHFAAVLLLVASALLIFLINCCYQNGAPERPMPRAKTYASLLGAIELLPLTGLAAWAILLRVQQYGWTVERILSAAIAALSAFYAFGYASSVIKPATWLKRIEITNLTGAYFTIVLILALFSPIADPGRLMVASQVARLESGAILPAKFDFFALKSDGARWGKAALKTLSQDKSLPNAVAINEAATHALNENIGTLDVYQPVSDPASHITVYPAGITLPPAFYTAAVNPNGNGVAPACMRSATKKCIARIVTLTPNTPFAILFEDFYSVTLFQQSAPGLWQQTAFLEGRMDCPEVEKNIASGSFTLSLHKFPDIIINGQSLALTGESNGNPCP